MTQLNLEALAVALNGGLPPRVWSLVVTVFGDLAQEEEAQISGTLLGQLTEALGIKPEATRVALHRLRKDGWINSHKQGRRSHYALTKDGREQAAKASLRIYDFAQQNDAPVVVIPQAGRTPRGATEISAEIFLAAKANYPEALNLPVPADQNLPDWIRAAVCDGPTVAMSAQLSAALDAVPLSPISPLQTAALRVAVVHGWRRLVLKTPTLPDKAFPADWQGAACRKKVAQILAYHARPALTALEP